MPTSNVPVLCQAGDAQQIPPLSLASGQRLTPDTVTFHSDAPYSMFPRQRHHSTRWLLSHSNMPNGCVVSKMFRPRHMLEPKLKSRCLETHFHSIRCVGRSQSSSTTLDRSTVTQRFSVTLSRMKRPFPEWRGIGDTQKTRNIGKKCAAAHGNFI
ncbi:hypothetical protein GOODEAATRI_002170 [Goodea atripinnis]|uniref:Uncharacterized protein n=1 Tax=Goodea atripinnis TaxID=208336 RepID=A0ABV0MNN3_9TELE